MHMDDPGKRITSTLIFRFDRKQTRLPVSTKTKERVPFSKLARTDPVSSFSQVRRPRNLTICLF